MRDINFYIAGRHEVGTSELRAEHRSDGHGTFDIVGDIDWTNLSFQGLKRYTSCHGNPKLVGFSWWWQLRLTPFGLIGDWYSDSDRSRAHGRVWLWKAK
jgi:hypothetical protein